jgi:hypothetical protein
MRNNDERCTDLTSSVSAPERALACIAVASTGEYVLIAGRPYTRDELTAEWALAQFPAEL